MSSTVDLLLDNPVSFLADTSRDEDIVISTRVRLARNLAGRRFPLAASEKERREVVSKVTAAAVESDVLGGAGTLAFDPEEMTPLDRTILLERRLASREFLEHPEGTRLLVRPDESCSVMINEEDQLRMQALRGGLQLEAAYREISALDDELGEKLDFAFDDRLGFLSCCPTNVGTGMRASVMLHLPGLVLTGQIAPTVQGINKLYLAVRGASGEGSDNRGNLFQVSNQATLGDSEEGIIQHLGKVIDQLISHEKNARKLLLERDRPGMFDLVGRAYGVMKHSWKLSASEALRCLSALRAGVDLGLFNHIDVALVNELFLAINPGHLQKRARRELSEEECNIYRAAYCREKLKNC